MRINHRLVCVGALHLVVACGGSSGPSSTRSFDDTDAGSASPSVPGEPSANGGGGSEAGGPGNPGGMGSSGAGATNGMGPATSSGGATDGTGGGANPAIGGSAGQALPLVLDGEPEHFRHVRLTQEQWENSIRDNLRFEGPTGWLDTLSPEVKGIHRYSNNEELLYVMSPLSLEYAEAAEALASRVTSDPVLLEALYSGVDALGFINEVTARFYRRPPTVDEVARLEAVFETGSGLPSATDPFSGGASLVLEVLLQSPHFLYRIEDAEPGARLDGYELATKLAYLITNTTPTDALLSQAAAGTLDTDDGLRAAALELLGAPEATATLRRFHSETFSFSRFATISKDPNIVDYPDATNALLLDASNRFFDHVFEASLGVRDVFLSKVAFADDAMAAWYEVDSPGGTGLSQVELGAERSGFFTQLPFLTLYSISLTPDSIQRGMAMNFDVLCAEMPPEPALPPPNFVDEPGLTNRERVARATTRDDCGICHETYLNPLGFAFENFDGLGRVRDEDNGQPVDTTGAYPFVEGQLEFDGAPQLMQLLAESQQAHRCYASHLAEFGLAHELGAGQTTVVDAVTAASLDEQASLRELMLSVVLNPAFHTRQGTP